ncbi:cS5 fimbrial minor pilin subunit [Escherichia coli C691-71 (14b)]|uniref:hypothetical protein n=1 Tax=Escherichia coli TaxID=562 RepID=UPI0002514FC8|nr:hypothetical protein [Escherichia coli]EHX95590.1 CS5 fimbrial minor pilin subunit [Escherichia coli DEC14D]KIG28143.1 cS5 fimbrial minor pilin subunit [Escherichia coli C691-71 (14b)]HBA6329874.1 fimbrial protein [Escherichia coli]HBA6334726.1 fimbrial protein [Escherichia coli]
MKKQPIVLTLGFFSFMVQAATTVTSEFEITNKTIEKYTISSTDSTMTYTDVSGSGLYKISDQYSDANVNIRNYGNHQFGLLRNNSTVNIIMKGVNLGHTFTVQGKYANSAVSVPNPQKSFTVRSNNGCSSVSSAYLGNASYTLYEIRSSNDVTRNCSGQTDQYTHMPNNSGQVNVTGIYRDFYLDIGRLQSDAEYRKAPPDTYIGTGTFAGEVLKNRVGSGYTPTYTNKITIIKKPYFESVTLPTVDNIFDTRTIGRQIQGNLVIPFVINGHFTPYNTISLQVISLNGFKLQSENVGSSATIPYSLNMTIGSERRYSLATNGNGLGNVTINNLESDGYSIQGRFNADFLIDKNTAVTGDYADTLTAIFQISLL